MIRLSGLLTITLLALLIFPRLSLAAEGVPSIFKEDRCFGDTVHVIKPKPIPPPGPGWPTGPFPTLPPIDCATYRPPAFSCASPKNDWFKNPFTARSAHHRPIGCEAIFADDHHPITQAMRSEPFGFINIGLPYGKPMYEGLGTDPLVNIGWNGEERGRGLPVSVHIPPAAQIPGRPDTDGTIVIYDNTTFIGTQLRKYTWGGGRPTASSGIQTSFKGLGHPASPTGSPREGPSASGTSVIFGLIRGFEMCTPGYPIEHITEMFMPGKGDTRFHVLLNSEWMWPANGHDGFCDSGSHGRSCTGPIKYGQLLAIPSNIDLTKLGLTEVGYRMAVSWQRYGVRVNDDGAPVGMRADQDLALCPEIKNQLLNDMRSKLYPMLRAVLNDSADQTASGGGSAIAPNCASDAH